MPLGNPAHPLQRVARSLPCAASYVIASGRGLAAVWLVEVLPREALARWQALEFALVDRFDGLGVDRAARDVTRVLRLAGTMHTKAARPGALPVSGGGNAGTLRVRHAVPGAAAVRPPATPARGGRGAGGCSGCARALRRRVCFGARVWTRGSGRIGWRIWTGSWSCAGSGRSPLGHRDFWMLIAAAALSWMIPASAVRREVRTLGLRAIGASWGEREVEARLGTVLRRAEAAEGVVKSAEASPRAWRTRLGWSAAPVPGWGCELLDPRVCGGTAPLPSCTGAHAWQPSMAALALVTVHPRVSRAALSHFELTVTGTSPRLQSPHSRRRWLRPGGLRGRRLRGRGQR